MGSTNVNSDSSNVLNRKVDEPRNNPLAISHIMSIVAAAVFSKLNLFVGIISTIIAGAFLYVVTKKIINKQK